MQTITRSTDPRTACAAFGWRWYDDNDTLRAWTGAGWGIAHAPTVEGLESHNDSVYATWAECYAEAVDGCYPPSGQAMAEGWCIIWSDSENRWAIQRNDESPRFHSDAEAWAHVHAQADAGSEYHRACLAFTARIACHGATP